MAKELGIERNFWTLEISSKNTSSWPKDKEELIDWYDKSTFSKEDIIKAVE